MRLKSRSDEWKLASYEVAGRASRKFARPERTMDSAVLSGRISLGQEPDTLCLANFRLSRWDEKSRLSRGRLELQFQQP